MDELTASLIVIFSLLGILCMIIAARIYRNGDIGREKLVFLLFFGVILILLGFAFIWHKHYMKYGFLHDMITLFVFALPFVLVIFIPDKDQFPARHHAVIYAMTAVILFFTAFKFTYIRIYGMSLYEVLPLNLCNLVAVMIAIRPFWRNRLFDNYILCFGLLGGIFNILLGTRYGFSENFYTDIVYESNITHNMFISYSLYMLLSMEIKPDFRRSLQNMYWLIPVFCVFVFTNQIYQFNFFFTSIYENPILAIYNLFPTFDITLINRVYEINLIYYLIVIFSAGVVLWVLAWILERAARKLPLQKAS